MVNQFTAKYTAIPSGYMGQIIEWPEVTTEGATLEECRRMLKDALTEMIAASRDLDLDIPDSPSLFESMSIAR